MTEARTVAVVGGGFAGFAAACRLAGDGERPILFERAPRLGGRAASFRDGVSGEDVDYGQHVSMRCCTATHGFLQRIGASSAIAYQPELAVPILCGADRSELRSNLLLPGALHLAPGLLRYRCLSRPERLRVARAALALLAARGEIPFGDWLRRHGQSERSIERLWDPICVATLNAHADEVSLAAARQVLREGFLSRVGAGLGLFARPLGSIFEAASAYLEARGGEVRRASAVRQVLVESHRVVGVELADGETVSADAVIAAVPPWDLRAIAPYDPLAPILDKAERLAWAPIVGVHLWLDRPILQEDFVIAVDSQLQAVFDVTRLHRVGASSSGEGRSADRPSLKQLRREAEAATVFDVTRVHGEPSAGGPHLVLSQSAARPSIDRPERQIVEELVDALGDLLPSAREAAVLRHFVIKYRRATFVPAPGAGTLRPASKTPIRGLYLAGDWTATGWPSTIEGAIRSGIAAAARATNGS